MLVMDYPSIRGEDLPDYSKKATWNLLHEYIDLYSQISIYECTGDGVQDISRLQYQYTNTTFADQSKYNIIFYKVVHKWRESAIHYIKILKKGKDLKCSVGNSYTEYQMMQTFLDNLQQGVKYPDQMASHQEELTREEKSIDQNHYLYLTYKLIILIWTIQ